MGMHDVRRGPSQHLGDLTQLPQILPSANDHGSHRDTTGHQCLMQREVFFPRRHDRADTNSTPVGVLTDRQGLNDALQASHLSGGDGVHHSERFQADASPP